MNNAFGRYCVLCYLILGVLCIADSVPKVESKSAGVITAEVSTLKGGKSSANRPLADGSHENKETSLDPSMTGQKNWISVTYLVFAIVLVMILSALKHPTRRYLAIGFAASWILVLMPYSILIAFGLVGFLACGGYLFHILFPKKFSEKSVFLGILFAVLGYTFAVAGCLELNADKSSLTRISAAFYEATQLQLMNMTPPFDKAKPLANSYFSWAGIFGCLFTYFLAYKTVVFFCNRAKTQFLLGCYFFKSRRRLAMVIGLGSTGKNLLSNLLDQGYRVVAIEVDKRSPQIERATELGAQVVVADALDERVYAALPFDAIESMYVVTGDDQRNLEIGKQLLTYSSMRVEKAKQECATNAPFTKYWLRVLKRKFLQNKNAVCHVQLYDSNMQRLMEREHFRQSNELSEIEMRHFNAQQNAVRDLIQRELSKPEVCPQNANEVGIYFLIGFGSLGQEVALGLARLAHFSNMKRSRLVIFCSNPEAESRAFLARYPKFTSADCVRPYWRDLRFQKDRDGWDFKDGSSQSLESGKYGVEFATNAIFTSMPASPSDTYFLEQIRRLTEVDDGTLLRPCLLVCDENVQKSFAWSSEFMASWKEFCRRNDLQPESPQGTFHPRLTTYTWLQGHHALRELLRNNSGLIPFGLEENCISARLLDATLLRQLGAVVQHSYNLSVTEDRVATKEGARLEPQDFESLKSNLHAAEHSLIKYRIAGGSVESILEKKELALPMTGTVDHFEIHSIKLEEPHANDGGKQCLLAELGQIEHNRWMADQLLKGYEFVEVEQRVDGKRIPRSEHQRATLCSWEQLNEHDRLKDTRQSFYVLYHLNLLAK